MGTPAKILHQAPGAYRARQLHAALVVAVADLPTTPAFDDALVALEDATVAAEQAGRLVERTGEEDSLLRGWDATAAYAALKQTPQYLAQEATAARLADAEQGAMTAYDALVAARQS